MHLIVFLLQQEKNLWYVFLHHSFDPRFFLILKLEQTLKIIFQVSATLEVYVSLIMSFKNQHTKAFFYECLYHFCENFMLKKYWQKLFLPYLLALYQSTNEFVPMTDFKKNLRLFFVLIARNMVSWCLQDKNKN